MRPKSLSFLSIFLFILTAWTKEVVLIRHYKTFCSDFYQKNIKRLNNKVVLLLNPDHFFLRNFYF